MYSMLRALATTAIVKYKLFLFKSYGTAALLIDVSKQRFMLVLSHLDIFAEGATENYSR